jgi:hypothetical protein
MPPKELKRWKEIFDEVMRLQETSPSGLMKLRRVPGEEKYAVAICDGTALWLTMWVRCSPKGEIFIMYPAPVVKRAIHMPATISTVSFIRNRMAGRCFASSGSR